VTRLLAIARETPPRAPAQPLKGGEGERTWIGWAAFAYNVEMYGRYA